jgi:hypothetical protein
MSSPWLLELVHPEGAFGVRPATPPVDSADLEQAMLESWTYLTKLALLERMQASTRDTSHQTEPLHCAAESDPVSLLPGRWLLAFLRTEEAAQALADQLYAAQLGPLPWQEHQLHHVQKLTLQAIQQTLPEPGGG